jgi:hypothetical protein
MQEASRPLSSARRHKQRAIEETRAGASLGDPRILQRGGEDSRSGGGRAQALRDHHPSEVRQVAAKASCEATFFIGETYFAESNFQQAAAEYNNVRKNCPEVAEGGRRQG